MRPVSLMVLLAIMCPAAGGAQSLTPEEALKLAFPEEHVERRTAYLEETQVERAGELAGPGVPVAQSVVTYYVARRDGQAVGAAYFDVHRVRTKDEVAMVVVGPDDRIRRIEVLRFLEPPEYRAAEGWIHQMDGHALGPDLSLGRGVVPMTGATLTSRALVEAARRVLALHAVIQPFRQAGPG